MTGPEPYYGPPGGCVITDDDPRHADEPAEAHRITWWAYAEPGVRIRRQATMRGTWGWDATCSCGWDSRIGSGTRRAVKRAIEDHKFDVAAETTRARP